MTEQPRQDSSWTPAHDLALIFITLAFGTDAELTDAEIEQVTAAVAGWKTGEDPSRVREIVLEALAVFEGDSNGDEVIRSVETLAERLEPASRRRALEDAMRIAEADGILLNSERTLLGVLAASWDLRSVGEALVAETTAQLDDRPLWSLLHDIALLAIAVAHGSTGSLDAKEIESMVNRLSGWRVDLDPDDLKSILGAAIRLFGSCDLREEIQRSATSINERLPHALRLIVLADLIAVAEADGVMNDAERDMIGSLAQAWQLDVRIEA